MGRDIQAIKISGEDRRKYREKVQRSLDVFARMLRERRFEASPSRVGVEIELNLVDSRGVASMRNAAVLDAIADPAWATELGQFNLETTVPPRRLEGHALAGPEEGNPARPKPRGHKGRGGRQPPGQGGHPAPPGRRGHARGPHPRQRPLPGAERADLRGPRGGPPDRDRRARAAADPLG